MTASTWSAASPANSTDAKARRAVEEYRRFAFLCCVADQELTPSLLVDEFWHLHLLHTRDYWQHWCPKVLRRPLHQGPTRGRPADNARYRRQYAATLALYEQHLGTPPATAWPGTARALCGEREEPAYRPGPSYRSTVAHWPTAATLGLAAITLVAVLIVPAV